MVGSSAEEVANFNILIYVVGFERRVQKWAIGQVLKTRLVHNLEMIRDF